MGHPVTHFQIAAEDAESLKAFYSGLFDWRFSPGGHHGVHDIDTGSPAGIQGDIIERGEYIPDFVSLYVATEDIAASLSRAEELGGQIVRPPFQPHPGIELGIFADPEGHVVTLVRRLLEDEGE